MLAKMQLSGQPAILLTNTLQQQPSWRTTSLLQRIVYSGNKIERLIDTLCADSHSALMHCHHPGCGKQLLKARADAAFGHVHVPAIPVAAILS